MDNGRKYFVRCPEYRDCPHFGDYKINALHMIKIGRPVLLPVSIVWRLSTSQGVQYLEALLSIYAQCV